MALQQLEIFYKSDTALGNECGAQHEPLKGINGGNPTTGVTPGSYIVFWNGLTPAAGLSDIFTPGSPFPLYIDAALSDPVTGHVRLWWPARPSVG